MAVLRIRGRVQLICLALLMTAITYVNSNEPCIVIPLLGLPVVITFGVANPQSVAHRLSSNKPYDVFINYRGKDVKNKLASTTYHMLDLKEVKVFFDKEELEVGDHFPQAIETAVCSAAVHIAIFCPNYAESPWCLEELSLMLQSNSTILPVFYGVDPSDLRYPEKGIYANAFRRHLEKGRYNTEEIEGWKEALRHVSNLSGWVVNTEECDVGKVSRKIVETTLRRLKEGQRSPSNVAGRRISQLFGHFKVSKASSDVNISQAASKGTSTSKASSSSNKGKGGFLKVGTSKL